MEEPYLPEPMESEEYHFEVPEDCCLFLGDNRNDSADARAWLDPYVPRKDIIAKAYFSYFPSVRKLW